MNSLLLFFAYITDLIIGDPALIPHPVIMQGKLITKLENYLYQKHDEEQIQLIKGGFLVFVVLSLTYTFSYFLLWFLYYLNPWLAYLAAVWLVSTTISAKGLQKVGMKIENLLKTGKLKEAREKVSYIVGRDTDDLDEKEITRATIETIAENIVDGITAPLFFAFLGGAPLALTYRAVNTMDSMLGYKNERYLYFGRMAAKTDDLFNYLPARLTGISIIVVSFLLPGVSGRLASRIFFRDRRKHLSPNSGYSESAVSGALGIRLGGLNYYQGQASLRPYMGEAIRELESIMIKETIKIMLATSTFWALLLTFANIFKSYF